MMEGNNFLVIGDYNVNNFHKTTKINKDTDTLYDTEGYNEEGYDVNGYDISGYGLEECRLDPQNKVKRKIPSPEAKYWRWNDIVISYALDNSFIYNSDYKYLVYQGSHDPNSQTWYPDYQICRKKTKN